MQIRRRVLDAWLRDLRDGWGDRAEQAAAAIAPTIAACEIDDLTAIGFHLASEGRGLDEVLAWFRLLAHHSRPFRQVLAGGGIIQLASGWADGLLHDDNAQAATPFEVLRLRLRQQIQQESVLGHNPGEYLALVVIEGDGAPSAVASIAQHVRSMFGGGETIASTPSGKLLVLVRRDRETHERTVRLTNSLRADTALSGATIRVWIEPLAMSADHVESHLLGLAS